MKPSLKKYLLCFSALLFLGLIPSNGTASIIGDSLGLSPFWDWKTLETKHFRITFPADISPQAHKVAQYLEEADLLLSPRLHWKTRTLTQIVVVDNTDLANGLTSAALRLGIVLLITPPDTTFSTEYYDDWLRLLCVHEYTHLLNMDVTRDWVELLRVIFGDAIRPNSLWPTWMLEGLAVYMETRLTHGGRGRSPFYEMVLRTAVEENTLNHSSFITLDKVNGTNPWFPAGETSYLFGYQMMNQVSKDAALSSVKETHDGYTDLKGGEDALGVMSYRSGGRVPFFINGNLENITGKDWYQYWDEWVAETRTRMGNELQKIKAQPVTAVKKISEPAVSILGVAVSPDGKWLAYTQDSSDDRMQLVLRNLQTRKTQFSMDKIWGSGLAFSPDSRTLFFSGIERTREYYLFSDLAAYDIERDSVHWLTSGARYKDPDVSRNGTQITFAITHHTANSIGVADIIRKGNSFEIGKTRIIYESKMFDSASNPKFSPDGKSVVFSFHASKVGKVGSDLIRVHLESGAAETIISDGKLNRFAAFGPSGNLYFVSDRSGVDNIYRVRKGERFSNPEQVTNMTSGVWVPAISQRGGTEFAYGSVFATEGWRVSELALADKPFSTSQATVDPAPAPVTADPTAAQLEEAKANSQGEVKSYSVIPSIFPRQWAPVLLSDVNRTLVGGQALGFDAIDEHEYLVYGAYDTLVKNGEGIIQYNNRSFGPNLTLYGEYLTTSYSASNRSLQAYTHKATARASLSYPIKWTFSSLTPAIGAQAQREFLYVAPNLGHPSSATTFVPSVDFTLTFDNTEASRLALLPEAGRRITGGVRHYYDSQANVNKGLLSWAEFIKIADHTVAVPAVAGTWVSRTSGFSDANANARSVSSAVLRTDSVPTERSLDQLRVRGYPGITFLSRSVALGSLDLQMPLARIFRGWGTNPFFLKNFYAVGFVESTMFPRNSLSNSLFLPSAGGGLRLSTDILLNLPLVWSAEYHQGFRKDFGGKSEFIFSILAPAITL